MYIDTVPYTSCLPHHFPSLHREAAERQIRELQRIIDDTFQQFALDDSEDDFEEDSANGSVPSLAGSDPPSSHLSPPQLGHSPLLGRKRGGV